VWPLSLFNSHLLLNAFNYSFTICWAGASSGLRRQHQCT
jgi:hypothetical protein